MAVYGFRQRHENYGPVLVFECPDAMEWEIWGDSEGEERYACMECGQYACVRQLLIFQEGCIYLGCWSSNVIDS